MLNDRIIGPYLFDENIMGVMHLDMLQRLLFSILEDMTFVHQRKLWFQQNRAPLPL
jgi:hypothetical protein